MLDLAASLKRAAGVDTPLEFAPHRPGEQFESFVDIDKARRELQWAPRVGLDDGLRNTFEWFAARANRVPVVS